MKTVLPTIVHLVALATLPAQDKARVLPYPIDLPQDFLAAIENGTRTETGAPGPAYWTNRARYVIQAELDPKAARVTARAEMTYFNRSPDSLGELRIHLRQNLHKGSAMRTRVVEVTDGVTVDEVLVDGTAVERMPRVRDTRMRLRLPAPLEPGAQTTVTMAWSYPVPTAGRAPRNGHEGEDVFWLAYWYPQFAVYDDVEGWVQDLYRGNGEFYMGYADYDVSWTVPAGYVVRMTGTLQNPEDVLSDVVRERLAAAEQSHDVVHVVDSDLLEAGNVTKSSDDGKLTWRFLADNVRDCAVSVARTYLWDATHAVVPDGDGGNRKVTIHALYEPRSGRWPRAAQMAQHTIEYMSKTVYPYPWPHMTACEGVIDGGMEFPMMTIVGRSGSPGTIAHELIHMWFPMLLGNNEKRYAWQDEGLTSYWTSLVTATFGGNEGAESSAPQRAIVGYLGGMIMGGDVVCMTHADGFVNDSHGMASYTKPACALHQLRGMLGDEVFVAAFRAYAERWAFKHPYPYDFFRTFSDVAGQDLDWYFRTWLFERWRLDHAVVGVQQRGKRARIAIEDVGRAMHPTTVLVTMKDGSEQRLQIDVDTWRGTMQHSLDVRGEVEKVQIDPDRVTLDADRKNNVWPAEEG